VGHPAEGTEGLRRFLGAKVLLRRNVLVQSSHGCLAVTKFCSDTAAEVFNEMRTTRSVRFLLLAIIFLVPEAVHAQSIIGDVWVMGEEEVSDSASCRLSYPSAIAAVQSVLRENRIPISYKRTPGHVRAYLNFTPINIGSACAVNYEIQVWIHRNRLFSQRKEAHRRRRSTVF